MKSTQLVCLAFSSLITTAILAEEAPADWNQWRGPTRDGKTAGAVWPAKLDEKSLTKLWRVELPPSYSGPIVSAKAVFTTATEAEKNEIVVAIDRESGKELWKTNWPGAMKVPFFAAANGSWVRSTPAFDGETLYVAGMKDLLVAMDAATGKIRWQVDFVEQIKTPVPAFGFASSPLLDGDALYVQAGASFVKLDKKTGKILWRSLKDDGGMMGSAFSSPVLATIAGKRQLVVQTRQKLAGVDPDNGEVLWDRAIPNFRGMNILTPVITGDSIFTSSYQTKSWLFDVTKSESGGKFSSEEKWNNNAQGYMSSPVVIDGHAYLHLQNQRFTCINLKTGERTWTSEAFGKYCSLISQNDRILALDQRGILMLIKANPKEFELIDQRKISDQETWAHLAIRGDELFIRELKGLTSFRWKNK